MNEVVKILEEILQGTNYHQIFGKINQFLERFQSLIREDKFQYDTIFDHSLRNFLGIGGGSTPESDDIFLGIITTMNLFEPELGEKLLLMSSYRYEDVTTKESSILIRRFLRKNYPREIKPFLSLMMKNKNERKWKRKFNTIISEVNSIGASSGTSFLQGVLWQLHYYENHK